jgi:hypothetical protein
LDELVALRDQATDPERRTNIVDTMMDIVYPRSRRRGKFQQGTACRSGPVLTHVRTATLLPTSLAQLCCEYLGTDDNGHLLESSSIFVTPGPNIVSQWLQHDRRKRPPGKLFKHTQAPPTKTTASLLR